MIFTYQQIASLNTTEIGIYNYIIKKVEQIYKMNIRQVAEKCHVSTTTVFRFTQKCGCEGFNEFKWELKQFVENNKIPTMDSEIKMLSEFLEFSKSEEFQDKIIQFAKIISQSLHILFLGIGTSGALGKYGARFFSNIGYYSQCIDDPFYPAPQNDDYKNVLIVLSVSGETKEVIDQIKHYQNKHYQILVITDSQESTIEKMADLSICYCVKNIILPQTYNISTQVPVVYIIERVARELTKIDKYRHIHQ